MGGDGRDDDSPGGLPSQYFKTDCGDYGMEGQHQGMGGGFGERGAGGNMASADKGLRAEAAGNNCEICRREVNLKTIYRCGVDAGVQ